MVAEQGSYAAGGTIETTPGTFDPVALISTQGNTNHGDHAYVRYQTPVRARRLPLVLWHGGGQFSRTWETTPDGREGYQSIMLRRGWSVHLVDQPRRAGAGQSTADAPGQLAGPVDRSLWQLFRLGVYPDFFPGSQFPQRREAVEQYWRQRVQDTGPEEQEVVVAGVSAVFDRVGPSVLITHSNSGKYGYLTAARQPHVRAIVSYEPGQIVVPDDYNPRPVSTTDPTIRALTAPVVIPATAFRRLTRLPIHVVFGDNIPTTPSPYAALDFWRIVMARTLEMRDLVNARGGDMTVQSLPEIGITGNTHFPFSDLNNLEVADELSHWLRSRDLDRR
ncbi:hypothetical protein JOF56_004841 [Kibdelosporangium banguiense]|uniref:Alpha/beta hydrolase n=1 Tax=Kibdelosporangium banguiense TaxID=1365924 RepID=A0ABS4TJB9_9PSEU|nr:alpha/beta fold hydrolase [Kibdelosporangium banguiense]MBP2324456.1 hypothetical protein [Kibdelosporangium banguiense]